jgi:manganese transport protein
MDPGDWTTDLAGGSRFGYTLLAVILLSNPMAILFAGARGAACHRDPARSRAGMPRRLLGAR